VYAVGADKWGNPRARLIEERLWVRERASVLTALGLEADPRAHLRELAVSLAALTVARSCNVGLVPVINAGAAALTGHRLLGVEKGYFHGEGIAGASARLAGKQAGIDITADWGGGLLASADGMRFVVPAGQPPPATPTVPIRPDGWPDWLGRRPMSNSDRDKIRQALTEGLPEGPLTDPGPFLCYLTIDGLHHTDPGNLIALRGRIHAAARTAAEERATTYHATDSAITIGIRGPDAADRINQLRHALAGLITKHGWTTRDQPR
jgi:hypothetical protein